MSDAKHTPGPWVVGGHTDGQEEAPPELSAKQRARWEEIMASRRKPTRLNDGSFVIKSDAGRVAAVSLRVEAKRGQAHAVDDPEALANAKLIAAAPDLLIACQAAIRYDESIAGKAIRGDVDLLATGGAIAASDNLDALYADWIDKARAAIARATE